MSIKSRRTVVSWAFDFRLYRLLTLRMFASTRRILRTAAQDFFRNWWLSLVTMSVVFLALCSVNLLALWTMTTDRVLHAVEERVDVRFYTAPTATEAEVAELRDYLRALSDVRGVTYISRDEALAAFRYAHRDDAVILDSLEELSENPFGAALVVSATTVDAYARIVAKVGDSPYHSMVVDTSFTDHERIIVRFRLMMDAVRRAGMVTAGVFTAIALLIVFNTIRVSMYTHRDEIGIMKRVGATNRFTQMPFLVQSVAYAMVSFGVATAAFFGILRLAQPSFTRFFGAYAFDLTALFRSAQGMTFFGIELAVVLVTTIMFAFLATRRYMKV